MYTIFKNGTNVRLLDVPPDALSANITDDDVAVAGDWSGHYLDADNMPVKIPNQPSQWHVWDHNSKTWQLQGSVLDDLWLRIRAERIRRTESGGFKVGDYWFHSDPHSRTQQVALVTAALMVLQSGGTLTTPLPGVTAWSTLSGEKVTMTAGLAMQILQAASVTESVVFEAAETHRHNMQASEEPWNYDFSGGWPVALAPPDWTER